MEILFLYYSDFNSQEDKIKILREKANRKSLECVNKEANDKLISIGFEFPVIKYQGQLYGYKEATDWLDKC